MNEHLIVITAALILVAGIFCQWIAWRLKLPAIIFLMALGILAGPVTGHLSPDMFLGKLLFPFISLSVAVILFEGSLTLKFYEIRGIEGVIRKMITLGMLVTCLITAAATRLALGFSWEICLLFGSLMVVTGPTVIVPMLRSVRPTASVSNILRWEGILIDPIGATLAVLVFEFIVSGGGQDGMGISLIIFGKILLIGLLIGAGVAHAFGIALRRYWIPQYLQNVAALSLVAASFAVSNYLEPESGLLTVTVMGVWLANMKQVELDEILDFKESLSLILISVLFIILSARMDLNAFIALGWPALAVFGAIQFLARPLNVQISAIGSGLSWPERHLLAWIAPRGIVAAAISSLFAMKLEALGYAEAHFMVSLTFMVIIGTVLLQSATARPIAKWLGVAEPEPKGFLIVGANLVARTIARELIENGFRALLADDNWNNVMDAKMEGIPVYYGNPVSEHAERSLDLVGIGRVLALTPRDELNALTMQYYRMEFGANNVFSIQDKLVRTPEEKMKTTMRKGGKILFGKTITYAELSGLLADGWDIKTTLLTKNFSFEDYLNSHEWKRIPMFAIDSRDNLHVFTAEAEVIPQPEWHVIGLTKAAGKN